jgi:hypothetical protein
MVKKIVTSTRPECALSFVRDHGEKRDPLVYLTVRDPSNRDDDDDDVCRATKCKIKLKTIFFVQQRPRCDVSASPRECVRAWGRGRRGS